MKGRRGAAGRSTAILVAAPLLLASATPQDDAPPEGGGDSEHIRAALEQTLADAPPPFCRDARHRLGPEELALCELSSAAQARCPAFAAACEQARGAGVMRTLPPGQSPPSSPRRAPLVWLRALAWPLRVVGLVLLAGLVVALLLALRALLKSSAPPAPGLADEPPTLARDGTPRETAGPASHLARARTLAAGGDHGRALIELHLGVLVHLDARGLVNRRPGRTNGDYARELAPQSDLLRAFRELSRAVEAVQFGGARLDAHDFERLLARAATLLPALIVGSCLSLLSIGCADGGSTPTASAACGPGADGHSLLCTLLEANGASVTRRYRPLDTLDDDDSNNQSDRVDVLILFRQQLEEPGRRALESWVRHGGLLVSSVPLPGIDDQLGIERNGAPCGVAMVAGSERQLSTLGPGFRATGLEADVRCSTGDLFVAHGPLGDGWVVALPSPSALSNASLASGDNMLLIQWVSYPDAVVELVGDWTRDAPENPLAQLRAAGLLPWLLQLMALGACYALYRGTPFARRRAPPEAGRRRFSEHAQALGQRWAEASASDAALAAYATYVSEQLRERLPAGSEHSAAGLAQLIADRTGKPVEAVARTLARARAAQLGPPRELQRPGAAGPAREPGSDEAEQLATLRALGRLLEEIGGPH